MRVQCRISDINASFLLSARSTSCMHASRGTPWPFPALQQPSLLRAVWIQSRTDTFSFATAASGYLVFSMQLGFALLTAGCVRAKSAKSVCLKNIMDAAFGGELHAVFHDSESSGIIWQGRQC